MRAQSLLAIYYADIRRQTQMQSLVARLHAVRDAATTNESVTEQEITEADLQTALTLAVRGSNISVAERQLGRWEALEANSNRRRTFAGAEEIASHAF